MFNFFKEISVFDNIKYRDSNHSYTIAGQRAISGTQLIGKFENEFNSKEVAEKVAVKRGVTVQSLLNEWTLNNVIASNKGSCVHNYLELSFQKRILEIDEEELYRNIFKTLKTHKEYKAEESQIILDTETCVKTIKTNFDIIIPTCDKFLESSHGVLIPLASELIIGDVDFKICGTIDQLYFNQRTNMVEIWDWKTNKNFTTFDKYNNKFKFPIDDLSTHHLNHYSLQLNLYKIILERNTNFKIGQLVLVNFAETLDGKFVYHQCFDYQDKVMKMIEFYNNQRAIQEENGDGKYEW